MPLNPDIELQPHQKRIRAQALAAAQSGQPYRGLLYWGTGSGKSFGALSAADALGGPATVIGPAALRQTLRGESQRLLGHNDYPVYSYNAAARGNVPPSNTLIIDEAQRLGSPGSAQSQAVQDLAAKAKNVIMMSATPVRNRPQEFAPLLSILQNRPVSHEEFANRYVGTDSTGPGILGRLFGRTATGRPAVVNTKELAEKLRGKIDVFEPDVPPVPVKEETVEAEMPARQAELYRGLYGKLPWVIRQKLKWRYPLSDSEIVKARSFLTGPRQAALSDLPYQAKRDPIKAFEGSGKLTAAYKDLQETLSDPRKKTITYSNFVESGLRPYSAALTRDKIPHAIFHGGLSDIERRALVDRFNRGDIRAALVAPAGSEGISLKGSQLIQLLDDYWNSARTTQAKARGIRFDSHTGLPEDLQNVNVRRYVARLPHGMKDRLLSRLGFNRERERETTDDYLDQLSTKKDRLNNQLLDVLRQSGKKAAAAPLMAPPSPPPAGGTAWSTPPMQPAQPATPPPAAATPAAPKPPSMYGAGGGFLPTPGFPGGGFHINPTPLENKPLGSPALYTQVYGPKDQTAAIPPVMIPPGRKPVLPSYDTVAGPASQTPWAREMAAQSRPTATGPLKPAIGLHHEHEYELGKWLKTQPKAHTDRLLVSLHGSGLGRLRGGAALPYEEDPSKKYLADVWGRDYKKWHAAEDTAERSFWSRLRQTQPRDQVAHLLNTPGAGGGDRPLFNPEDYKTDTAGWELFRRQNRGLYTPLADPGREGSHAESGMVGRPDRGYMQGEAGTYVQGKAPSSLPMPAGLVAGHEVGHNKAQTPHNFAESHGNASLGYTQLNPINPIYGDQTSGAELTPSLTDIPNIAEYARLRQKEMGRPVTGLIDPATGKSPVVKFPGRGFDLEWMRQQAQEKGLLSGDKGMAELLNTNAGRAWLKQISGSDNPADKNFPPAEGQYWTKPQPQHEDYVAPTPRPVVQKAGSVTADDTTAVLELIKLATQTSPESITGYRGDAVVVPSGDAGAVEELVKLAGGASMSDMPLFDSKSFKEALAPDSTLGELLEAKRHSDEGNYDGKTDIVRRVIARKPKDWLVDGWMPPRFVGLTHVPTGFRLHMPHHLIADLLPDANKVQMESQKPSTLAHQGANAAAVAGV